MRIVVTGGSGAVGSGIVTELLARGHQVVNLDQKQPPEPRVPLVFGDVRNRELLHRVFDGADAVIHLAEIPNTYFPLPANEIFSNNTTAGSAVLQTAADMKIKRVLYTSSFQVYGAWGDPIVAPDFLPVDESHPLRPQNVYAAGKVANEIYARVMCEHFGISVAVIRLPFVLARPEHRSWIFQRPQSAINEFGTMIDVSDAARGYAMAVESNRTGFETYNLAGAETMSRVPLRDVLKELPDYPQLPVDWPDRKGIVDCSKAHDHFGWEPTWSYWEAHDTWHRQHPGKA